MKNEDRKNYTGYFPTYLQCGTVQGVNNNRLLARLQAREIIDKKTVRFEILTRISIHSIAPPPYLFTMLVYYTSGEHALSKI